MVIKSVRGVERGGNRDSTVLYGGEGSGGGGRT